MIVAGIVPPALKQIYKQKVINKELLVAI